MNIRGHNYFLEVPPASTATAMEEAEKRILGQYRHRLANEIVVTESFLCAFCESNVLDNEMTALVKNEHNYVSKANKLLEMLPKRGAKAFATLLEILSITNPWLAEKMKQSYIEEKSREAKLKIASSITASGAIFGLASDKASITGYGATGQRLIDEDIKRKAADFVRRTLYHLTETEQRGTEKWLSQELQKERTKQQDKRLMSNDPVRIPTSVFHSSKEVQTETTAMELQELYEDIAIHMYGTDFNSEMDVSVGMIREMVMEVLDRMNCLDRVMMECMDKFEDMDRITMSLPQLVERATINERDMSQKLSEEKRKYQRLVLEKEYLSKRIGQLEADLDRLYDKHNAMFIRPQKSYVRKKPVEVAQKYTRGKSDQTSTHSITIIKSGDKGPDRSRDPSPVAVRRTRHTGRSSQPRSSQPRSSSRPRRTGHHTKDTANLKVHRSNFDVKFEPSVPSPGRKAPPSRSFQLHSTCCY